MRNSNRFHSHKRMLITDVLRHAYFTRLTSEINEHVTCGIFN